MTAPSDRTEVLDVAAVAAWLQCSPRTVQRKARDLGGFQFGKGLRFTRTAVEAYLERVTRCTRVTVLPPAAPRQIAAGKRGGEYVPVFGGRP